jgi:hypothetical protein
MCAEVCSGPAITAAPPEESVDANILETRRHFGPLVPFWFYDQVATKPIFSPWRRGRTGPWNYKKTAGRRYEPFGNFNYGATCYSAGFSLEFCQRMAGWAQGQGGNPRGAAGQAGTAIIFGGVWPFGDEITDALQVQDGYLFGRDYTSRVMCGCTVQ